MEYSNLHKIAEERGFLSGLADLLGYGTTAVGAGLGGLTGIFAGQAPEAAHITRVRDNARYARALRDVQSEAARTGQKIPTALGGNIHRKSHIHESPLNTSGAARNPLITHSGLLGASKNPHFTKIKQFGRVHGPKIGGGLGALLVGLLANKLYNGTRNGLSSLFGD